MPHRLSSVACVAACLALTALAPLALASPPAGGKARKVLKEPEIGDAAPPWAGLRDQGGRMLSLRTFAANPRLKSPGKIVLMSFFATWCKPCQKELPMLLDFARTRAEAGVEVVLVGFQEEDEKLRAFVQEKGIVVPVANDRYGKTSERYGVDSLPRLYVIDRDGHILGKIRGEHDDLDQQLDAILKTAKAG